jgi:hypothetical protein
VEQLNLYYTEEYRRMDLEREFSDKLQTKTRITVTRNRSNLLSVHKEGNDQVHLRVQEIFLRAPQPVWEAIGTFIVSPSTKTRRIIRDFISQNRPADALKKSGRTLKLTTQGVYYQLDSIYQALNSEYFNGEVKCHISWGKPYLKKRKRSISFGNYDGFSNLIKINPSLDHPKVPDYFIRYIVYHEMLHAKLENVLKQKTVRRAHHPVEFCESEKKFLEYEKAIAWEKKYIRLFIK